MYTVRGNVRKLQQNVPDLACPQNFVSLHQTFNFYGKVFGYMCVFAIRRDISSKYHYVRFSAGTHLTFTQRFRYLNKYGLSRQ